MRQISWSIFVIAFACAMVFSQSERQATIQNMIGSVKVRRGEASVWKDARPKMPIMEKDAIRTFVESQVELVTSEGSVIKLDENTTMEVASFKQYPNGSQATKVSILSGAVLSNVKKLMNNRSQFEFETPTATASIRGTKLGLEVTSEKTSVKVYEGEVIVTPKGASAGLSVKANQMTTIVKDQKTSAIEVLTERQKKTIGNPDSARANVAPIDTSRSKSKADSLKQGAPFVLNVVSPSEGQTFSVPMITVSGSTTAGAEVTINGIKCQSSTSGLFSMKVPIPDEENTIVLEIEASLKGAVKRISRQVVYKPNLTLVVSSPQNLQIVNSTSVPIAGSVTPAKAELMVSETKMPIAGSGKFTGIVHIPDEEGNIDLNFEASYEGMTKKETRTIVYKRSMDMNKPILQPTQLPKIASTKTISFTVFDKTPDDEITFYTSIDGSISTESGQPNSNFKLELQEGVHAYMVYAEDKARNRTAMISADVGFLKSRPVLQIRKPARSPEVIHIPPGTPNGSFRPIYTVEFSILNLPDNDRRLIKEASVKNESTGQLLVQKDLMDLNLYFDMDLKRGENRLTVKVKDINDNEMQYSSPIIIEVR
jgi:hypothetical protein